MATWRTMNKRKKRAEKLKTHEQCCDCGKLWSKVWMNPGDLCPLCY